MYALMDPSSYWIDRAVWLNDDVRAAFETRLLDLCEALEASPGSRTLFSDEVLTALFADERLAWNMNPAARNRVMPLLRGRVFSRLESLPTEQTIATVEPHLPPDALAAETGLRDAFLRLAAAALELDVLDAIALGAEFKCSREFEVSVPDREAATVPSICGPRDVVILADPLAFWPTNRDDESALRQAVMITWLKHPVFSQVALREWAACPRFTAALSKERIGRGLVLEQMVRRLTMSTAEAALDSSIQDELVAGRPGVHRMRVDQARRIHYVTNSDGVEFIEYWARGQHDAGL